MYLKWNSKTWTALIYFCVNIISQKVGCQINLQNIFFFEAAVHVFLILFLHRNFTEDNT